uniref:Interleukin n=1 Tax=Gopherus evgoodei TaxID=1825980 RepID=A0A8C4VX96_9SAUR
APAPLPHGRGQWERPSGPPKPIHLPSPSHILLLPQQVCMAENLNCFHTELRVIQWEHREHTESLSLLIRHLSQLEKLRTCKTDQQCHPCEGHREQPMPQFLSKLLEQLQWDCWVQGSNMHSCPSRPG